MHACAGHACVYTQLPDALISSLDGLALVDTDDNRDNP